MRHVEVIETLVAALKAAQEHLEYCGYGDAWERECAGDLSNQIFDAISTGEATLAEINDRDINYTTPGDGRVVEAL